MTIERFAILVVLCAGCGTSSQATCVPGATNACLCVGGASGVQTCISGGVFDACECLAADASASVDATLDASAAACPVSLTLCGAHCVDTSTDETNCGGCADATHTCATGSFCIASACQAVASCPTPFLICGTDCIDPRNDSAHCGATTSCSGTSAGASCSGACMTGRCVHESCADALAEGHSTGDGLYLVDVDGPGPLAPQDVYCDMTTAGGGWTLTYLIRNDIPNISDPWWGMVGVGSGTAFPMRAPLPDGTHWLGPTRETRYAYALRGGGHVRATRITPAGTTILDVSVTDPNGVAALAAEGHSSVPYPNCGPGGSGATVLAAQAPSVFHAGDSVTECFYQDPNEDLDQIRGGSPLVIEGIVGDSSLGDDTSTTLFWVR